jgi:hypothetical protein
MAIPRLGATAFSCTQLARTRCDLPTLFDLGGDPRGEHNQGICHDQPQARLISNSLSGATTRCQSSHQLASRRAWCRPHSMSMMPVRSQCRRHHDAECKLQRSWVHHSAKLFRKGTFDFLNQTSTHNPYLPAWLDKPCEVVQVEIVRPVVVEGIDTHDDVEKLRAERQLSWNRRGSGTRRPRRRHPGFVAMFSETLNHRSVAQT